MEIDGKYEGTMTFRPIYSLGDIEVPVAKDKVCPHVFRALKLGNNDIGKGA